MPPDNRELWWSFFAMLGITTVYLFFIIWFGEIPQASGVAGHSLGILGFVLMLITETLYSFRKRTPSARWGRMSGWLKFHIFTGITGAYMVLLHTSWKFNGLAGVVMLMTVVVVVSGFIGRYIYTAIPRTVDGAEIEVGNLQAEIARSNSDLQDRMSSLANRSVRNLLQIDHSRTQNAGRPAFHAGELPKKWLVDLRWKLLLRQLDPAVRSQAQNLRRLIKQKEVLERQVASLAITRRLFALWHTVHIPIGVTLFVAAFIHILAAIYYATLLH